MAKRLGGMIVALQKERTTHDLDPRTLVRAIDEMGISYKVHTIEFEAGVEGSPDVVWLKLEED